MPDADEDRLLAELAQGREDAFAALYDGYAQPLYRVAWTLLRSHQEAEDAVAEVFLGLVRTQATLSAVENLRAYLFASLRHAAGRLVARRKTQNLPNDELPAPQAGGSIDAELFHLLEQGLATLPAEQREVLTLKIDGNLTFIEVAAVLNIRPKTAASRYRYAIEKLRALIEAGRYEPQSPTTRHA
jgi:RNA polymerase sigma-70 factor (ECF subfamily)